MDNTKDFLDQCNALTSGQPLKEILSRARDLLTNPARWTRRATARDIHGNKTHPGSQHAFRWCIEGAVAICSNPGGIAPPAVLKFLDHIAAEAFGMESVNLFNDQHDHEDVLIFLDEAITRSP